jgi:hypothetical protein
VLTPKTASFFFFVVNQDDTDLKGSLGNDGELNKVEKVVLTVEKGPGFVDELDVGRVIRTVYF